jgi:hemolysin activation/secretion protein
LGQPITAELTKSIVNAVVALNSQQNRYLVDVYFSAQANQHVRDGILVLTVQPATVGRVIAQGQSYTKAQDLECRITLQAGSPVDLKQLEADIHNLNYSSKWRATSVQPVLRPGEQPGSTDIVLNTQDEEPQRFYVGADNTGNRSSNTNRVRAGVSLGHVGGHFDHQLDYNFAASPDFKQFSSHSLAYGLPLQAGERLNMRADYMSTDVMFENNTFHSKGDNTILTTEWSRSLASQVTEGHARTGEIYGGAEIKRIGSALAFGQTAVSDHLVQVAQMYGGWRNGWQHSVGAGQLDVRGTWSPGKLMSQNDDASYNAVRKGAKARYWRINTNLAQNFELLPSVAPRWQLSTRLTTQLANAPLIASERMGLSGSGGVRGYYQDTLYADAGVVGTLELQSPRWSVPTTAVRNLDAQFIVFVDAGRSHNADTETISDLNTTTRDARISSQGLGMRLNAGRNFSLRADVARRNNGLSDDKRWLWQVSAQMAF